MKLTIFNGSPRGRKSNTDILLGYFQEGFLEKETNSCEIVYLYDEKQLSSNIQKYETAEIVLIAFPLYTDCMPAIVKNFIEGLAPLCTRASNPPIGFIVQSGFPEAKHSRYIEKYLIKLSQRLQAPYLGTVIKGGVEGIQAKPPFMNRKIKNQFRKLGYSFSQNKNFEPALLKEIAQPEVLSASNIKGLNFLNAVGLTNMYWNDQLNDNDVYDKKNDRPYQTEYIYDDSDLYENE